MTGEPIQRWTDQFRSVVGSLTYTIYFSHEPSLMNILFAVTSTFFPVSSFLSLTSPLRSLSLSEMQVPTLEDSSSQRAGREPKSVYQSQSTDGDVSTNTHRRPFGDGIDRYLEVLSGDGRVVYSKNVFMVPGVGLWGSTHDVPRPRGNPETLAFRYQTQENPRWQPPSP
jgi:hypothetical protein